MNIDDCTYSELAKSIRQGGEAREQMLKAIAVSPQYFEMVEKVVQEGCGEDILVEEVFENTLVRLDRCIRLGDEMPNAGLRENFEFLAKLNWAAVLQQQETIRKRVLMTVGNDKVLQKEVAAKIMKNQGSQEDAEDCFHNGMLLLNANLEAGKYRGGSMKGYVYQICYNLWRNELKKHKSYTLQEDFYEEESPDNPHRILENKESAETLRSLLNKLGESCKRILHLKYFIVDQFTMEEIAHRMELKNAQNASNLLSKCRARLWDMLQKTNEENLPLI